MKYDILTVKEVAEELRCSPQFVYAAIRGRVPNQPILPAIKLGRRRVVRREVLNRWIEQLDGVHIPASEARDATPAFSGKPDEATGQVDRPMVGGKAPHPKKPGTGEQPD